jgi:hypothetical protein
VSEAARYRPSSVSVSNESAGAAAVPFANLSGANIAPRPERSSDDVNSVAMSAASVLCVLAEMVVPATTG